MFGFLTVNLEQIKLQNLENEVRFWCLEPKLSRADLAATSN